MVRQRGSRLLTLLVLGAWGVSACGEDEASTDESGQAAEVVPAVPVPEEPPPPPPDRNPDGSLLEGDSYVGGLRLPRGLRETAVNQRQHFYEGPYVPEAYVDYFGPRLLTGQVQPLPGGGARYTGATAREARGATVVMDVVVSPGAPGTTIVTIDELPPPPVDPPSEQELLRELQRDLERPE
ncbi:MAG: hypothetical protein ACK6CU_27610 [Deltaproteobacteria bacterium]|jgi:hypothetical protein